MRSSALTETLYHDLHLEDREAAARGRRLLAAVPGLRADRHRRRGARAAREPAQRRAADGSQIAAGKQLTKRCSAGELSAADVAEITFDAIASAASIDHASGHHGDGETAPRGYRATAQSYRSDVAQAGSEERGLGAIYRWARFPDGRGEARARRDHVAGGCASFKPSALMRHPTHHAAESEDRADARHGRAGQASAVSQLTRATGARLVRDERADPRYRAARRCSTSKTSTCRRATARRSARVSISVRAELGAARAGARVLPWRRLHGRQRRHARRAVPHVRARRGLRGGVGRLPARARAQVSNRSERRVRRAPVAARASAETSASIRRAWRLAAIARAARLPRSARCSRATRDSRCVCNC